VPPICASLSLVVSVVTFSSFDAAVLLTVFEIVLQQMIPNAATSSTASDNTQAKQQRGHRVLG
jgi:hypothetical protein